MEYNLAHGVAFLLASIVMAFTVGIPMYRAERKTKASYIGAILFFGSMIVLNIMNGLLIWVRV